ncbi:MAG TPA: tetratricopeptide repeat protein, partial [Thermoanaerobaculia bacterium]|nr:tetratricopeptide repeat protein [Thermoanaerobaculia bacterium]
AAAAAFERARKLEPGHAAATFNLAVVYGHAGELDRAHRLLAGLEVDDEPEIVALHRASLGEIDLLLGDHAAARVAAATAVELAPEAAVGQLLAARLELADGRPRSAVERLRPLAARTPGSAGLVYWTARAEIAAGELSAARQRLGAAARSRGLTAETALGLLAHLRAADGDRAGARRAAGRLDALLAAHPEHEGWAPRLHAAEAAAALGDADAALTQLDAAVARGLVDAVGVASDPAFGGLREEPRFVALLGEMERRVELLRRRMGR